MDRPPPDPRKLLDEWMDWERGDATPGRVMANLKTAGLRDILELLVAQAGEETAPAGDAPAGDPSEPAPAWTPTV
jgi:hypothetical protein